MTDIRLDPTCVTGKIMHATAEDARAQIRSLKTARDRKQGHRRRPTSDGVRQHERNGRELSPYRCASCNHWHVGHS